MTDVEIPEGLENALAPEGRSGAQSFRRALGPGRGPRFVAFTNAVLICFRRAARTQASRYPVFSSSTA